MQPDFERLPAAVYSVAQVRAMDRATIDEYEVPGIVLMEKAAAAALQVLLRRWPHTTGVWIYCGLGNNAGDGYVLARLADAAGLEVRVIQCAPASALGGDAAIAWHACESAGVAAAAFDQRSPPPAGVLIVDALFGTGLSRPLSGTFAQAVKQITASGQPVLSLDVPSGLDADTGLTAGPAIRAQCTIAFVGLKTGYFLGVGPAHCGALECADLDVPAVVRERQRPRLKRLGGADIRAALPPRSPLANKGDCGRVLVLGGGPGMAGAVRLAGSAALRSGAGLVYVATHPEHARGVSAQRPELIVYGVETPVELAAVPLRFDAIVLGPGLGRSAWAAALCAWALAQACPIVIDADGLNWLAEAGQDTNCAGERILTPHPGEAGRLLGCTAAEVQHDRYGAVTAIAQRYAATVVLKGACTLIAAPGEAPDVRVCLAGNPGMASAGTGDVLAGLIGGVLVQSGDIAAATAAAVLVHALAGDTAAQAGERGLLASDLLTAIRPWVNPL